jgi:integrase
MDVFDALTPLAASRLRASVISPFAQVYWDRLCDQGYALGTVRLYLNCLAHFAHWAARQRVELAALDHHVKRFVDWHLPRCRCVAPVQRTRHSVRSALEHFKIVVVDAGVRLQAEPLSRGDEQLQRFDRYLLQMKGLTASTRHRRLVIMRPLASMANDAGLPTPDQLRQFLHQELSRVSVASAGVTTTAVRSYLRFRAFEGGRVEHLLPIVASPASWRLAPLPQILISSEVQRLLDAFPPGLPSRLRCYAIVRCLVDLGLRSSEVIALELDHIDWAAGTVRICKTKSRRVDILPLPQATGAAIAEYIRSERPQTSSRRIFVRHLAPVEVPVAAGVVRRAVREAYRRAGLPHTRVHILRHTLASRLLNTGGTLKEVADVLRHRELDTSLIYAKVDFARLGAVAMPWPGSQA